MGRTKLGRTGVVVVKKGCLIAVAALLGLLGAGGAGTYWYASQMLGLAEAPVVGHRGEITENTRFILAVQPRTFDGLIQSQATAQISKLEAPEFVKNLLLRYATTAIPNEVAVLADFEETTGNLEATLFINERHFGPAIAALTQNPGDYPQFHYDGPTFRLPERGRLLAEWSYPYLYGVSAVIDEYWPALPPRIPMQLEGGHLAEAMLDNRRGELFHALGVSIAQRQGTIDHLVGPLQSERMRANLMRLISDAHFTLDRDPNGRMAAQLASSQYEDSPSPLAMRYSALSGPEVFALFESQLSTGQLDWQALLLAAVEYLENFSLDWHFDNRREEFMELMGHLINFDATPEMQRMENDLKMVVKLMEESTLTAFMLENGDVAGEWKVMSHPDNAGSVYLTLSALPINHPQGLLFFLRDFARQLNMRFEMATAEMADDAAYLQRFTIYNFQGGLRDLVAGRVGMPVLNLPPPTAGR
jgi:hypothetical protein